MSDREELDRRNRLHALKLAVESHTADGHTAAVLTTAARYLEWLRQPFPAATLTLRIGKPTTK